MRLFKSHIDAYYRHQKILRDLRFLCELNGAPFKPRTVKFLITRELSGSFYEAFC